MNKQNGNVIVWLLVIGVLFSIFSGGGDDSYKHEQEESEDATEIIYRDEAIDLYWDEIKEYVNGTETIEACSAQSGNCYDLDADISSGAVDQIYFDNGGYLYFGADIDSNGYASEYSYNGDVWDFYLDMGSSIVEDGIYDWASDNGYELE